MTLRRGARGLSSIIAYSLSCIERGVGVVNTAYCSRHDQMCAFKMAKIHMSGMPGSYEVLQKLSGYGERRIDGYYRCYYNNGPEQ